MATYRNLGSLERRVLEYLWKNGPSTAEAVRLGLSSRQTLTDSTIRTVLRRLEEKEYVQHQRHGRQFVYSSVRESRQVAAEAVRNILKTFCRGSLQELLTGLVDHKVVDSAELRRLAESVEARDRDRKKKAP